MKQYNFVVSVLIIVTICVTMCVTSDNIKPSHGEPEYGDANISKQIISSLQDRPRQGRYYPFDTSNSVGNLTSSHNIIVTGSSDSEVESEYGKNNNSSSSSESQESHESLTEVPQPSQVASRHLSALKGGPRGIVDGSVSYGSFGGSSKEMKDHTGNDTSTPLERSTDFSKRPQLKHRQTELRSKDSIVKSSSEKNNQRMSAQNDYRSNYNQRVTLNPSASEVRDTHAEAQEEAPERRPSDTSRESGSREHDESAGGPDSPGDQGDPRGAGRQPQLARPPPPPPPFGTRMPPGGHSNDQGRPEPPADIAQNPQLPPPAIRQRDPPIGPLGPPPGGPTVGRGPVFPQGLLPGRPPFSFGPGPVGQDGFMPVQFSPQVPNGGRFQGNNIGHEPLFGLPAPHFGLGPANFNGGFNGGQHFNQNQFNINGIGNVGSQFNFGPQGTLANGSIDHPLVNVGVTGQDFDGTYNGLFGSAENEYDGFDSPVGNPFLTGDGFGAGLPHREADVNFNQGTTLNGGFQPPAIATGFRSQNGAGSFRPPSPGNFGSQGGELAGSPGPFGLGRGTLPINALEGSGGAQGFTQLRQASPPPQPVFDPAHQPVPIGSPADAPIALGHPSPNMASNMAPTSGTNVAPDGSRPYHIIPGGNFQTGGSKSSATDLHFALRPYRIPPCALSARGNMTYCTTDDHYPHESVVRSAFLDPLTARRLVPSADFEEELAFAESKNVGTDSLHDLNQGRDFFRLDLNGIHKVMLNSDPARPKLQVKPPLSEACSSEVQTVQPMRAKSTRGAWKVIVNVATPLNGQKYTQYVRIETCRNTGTSCDQLNIKQRSQCVQKETTRRLAAWSPEEGLHVDTFQFPVACSCLVA